MPIKKGGDSRMTTGNDLQKVTLFVPRNLHQLMKELAKRNRLQLGVAYEQAITMFLSQTRNYMGSKRERQLKKGHTTNG